MKIGIRYVMTLSEIELITHLSTLRNMTTQEKIHLQKEKRLQNINPQLRILYGRRLIVHQKIC